IFNVSGGEALNVREVVERVAEKARFRVRWRKAPVNLVLAYAALSETTCKILPKRPEPRLTLYSAGLFAFTQTLNIEAAKAHLSWTPRVSFAEGLRRTFEETSA